MNTDIRNIRKEFSIWAAYRAAQAGSALGSGLMYKEAIQQSNLINYLDLYQNEQISQSKFDLLHKKWCEDVISVMGSYNIEITFGIAAKFINVFLKGYFILGGNENTELAFVIHPPIDSFLLKSIDIEFGTNFFATYKWRGLSFNNYKKLVTLICKDIKGEGEPLWSVEKYWASS